MSDESTDCELCAQRDGATVVYANQFICAFVDAEPLATAHLAVIPSRHIQRIGELNATEAWVLLSFVNLLVDAVREATGKDAVVVINTGDHRSQEHLTVHIVPSEANLRELFAAAEGVPPRIERPVEELAAVAARVRACLKT